MTKSLARIQRDAAHLEEPPAPTNPALSPQAIERDLRILLDQTGAGIGIDGPGGSAKVRQALSAELTILAAAKVPGATDGYHVPGDVSAAAKAAHTAEHEAMGSVVGPARNAVTNDLDGLKDPLDGRTVFRSIPPADILGAPIEHHAEITSAISTTAVAWAYAGITARRVRVASLNNGASGAALLRIAINCDNDVEGLMASQSDKRRDYSMAIGDAVILVADVPITSVHVSSDTAIAAGAHSLKITFGN